jgi:eukaryotic-like serine/threonine-protein kinase
VNETTPERPPLTLAGFEVHHLLGCGSSGEVWLARDEAEGHLVALKRLHAPRETQELQRLTAHVRRLAQFVAEHVLGLRAVLADAAGAPVLVLDHAAGGSLASLLARRGRLSPGEVVTTAAPLAAALAEAAGHGLWHGNLRSANVLFDARGKPLLADLGLAEVTADPPGDPGGDVSALAALCVQALAGAAEGVVDPAGLGPEVPPALVAVLSAALDPSPAARPDATEFAAALRLACPAEPVRLRSTPAIPASVPVTSPRADAALRSRARRPTAAAGRPEPRTAGRGAARHRSAGRADRWRERLLDAAGAVARPLVSLPVRLGIAALAVLVAAGAFGVWLAGTAGDPEPVPLAIPAPIESLEASPEPEPEPEIPSVGRVSAPVPRSAETRFRRVLDELDGRRAEAFVVPDVALLEEVYAPGSAPLAADTATLEALVDAGASVSRVRHELREVSVVDQGDARVRLRVVDELPEHVVLDADGNPLEHRPGRGPAAFEVELVDTGEGWRIAAITAA